MGKKDRDLTPNPTNIPNKDIIQRLNFLYQASVYLTNLAHGVPPSTSLGIAKDEGEGEQDQVRNREQNQNQDQDPNLNLNPKLKALKSKQARRASRLRTRTADELARAYVDTMAAVGKKTLVKMYVLPHTTRATPCYSMLHYTMLIMYVGTDGRDPSIKRTLCRACKAVLVPGLGVQVRVRRSSSHRHAVVLRCARCGYGRRLPAPGRKEWDGRGRWVDGGSGGGEREGEEDRLGPNAPSTDQKEEEEEKESGDAEERETGKAAKKRKRKKGKSRRVYPPLALSARRDAGHIVFRGTERVDVQMDEVDEVGDGVFAV